MFSWMIVWFLHTSAVGNQGSCLFGEEEICESLEQGVGCQLILVPDPECTVPSLCPPVVVEGCDTYEIVEHCWCVPASEADWWEFDWGLPLFPSPDPSQW